MQMSSIKSLGLFEYVKLSSLFTGHSLLEWNKIKPNPCPEDIIGNIKNLTVPQGQ